MDKVKTRSSWSLCIPTLNRIDALEQTVRLALAQTIPPIEIIIVDVSADWIDHAAIIRAICAGHPATRLVYTTSDKRSGAVQRNIALGHATGDIIFFFDDDSFMFPDCAEQVLALYDRPNGDQIAGAFVKHTGAMPNGASGDIAAKHEDREGRNEKQARLNRSSFGRFFRREVAMMGLKHGIIPYDRSPSGQDEQSFEALGIDDAEFTPFIPGYGMTVRREIALREPFDSDLLAYCPAEDVDASYRFSRHGFNVRATRARLHHFEAAGGRLKRRQATALRIMNIGFMAQKNAGNRTRVSAAYAVYVLRALLAEFTKDALTRRFDMPQFRGALIAARHAPQMMLRRRESLSDWYVGVQKDVLRHN